jgi:sugar phosphate isomerase/epimerase
MISSLRAMEINVANLPSQRATSRREMLRAGVFALNAGSALSIAAQSLSAVPFRTSRFRGVALGIQSRSFQDRSLEDAIAAMAGIGFGICEVSGVHLEPRIPSAELRKWRLTVPLDHFADAGKKFRQAGIEPDFLTYNLLTTPPLDAEIARGFEMAQAFGAKAISCSTKLSVVPAIDAAARRYKMRVGLHNHSSVQPDQVTTPDDFAAALRGRSEYIAITLDIGHFTAAGFNAALWFSQHSSSVISLHIKDRKKNQGPNVPFGQGDTPIAEVLRYARDKAPHIPALIEYEYDSKDRVAEIRNCFDYCRNVLLS